MNPQPKPGWKTTEFWLSLASGVASFVVPGLPPKYGAIVSAGVTAAYTISRGLAKQGAPQLSDGR